MKNNNYTEPDSFDGSREPTERPGTMASGFVSIRGLGSPPPVRPKVEMSFKSFKQKLANDVLILTENALAVLERSPPEVSRDKDVKAYIKAVRAAQAMFREELDFNIDEVDEWLEDMEIPE